MLFMNLDIWKYCFWFGAVSSSKSHSYRDTFLRKISASESFFGFNLHMYQKPKGFPLQLFSLILSKVDHFAFLMIKHHLSSPALTLLKKTLAKADPSH